MVNFLHKFESMTPNKIRKITFRDDFEIKEQAFLRMTPLDRLRWNEEMRRKIWGKKLNTYSYKGMKVLKKKIKA